MAEDAGVLYVVATPIGNLGDMSLRAREVLAAADVVACEDTRHSRPLLTHFGIATALVAYHEHNEVAQTPKLLARLTAGASIALISDAGTPLVSDPGYVLVRAARAAGVRVVPVPGPSAPVCALSAAGLPSDRFLFLGFPPRGAAARREWIGAVAGEPGTLIMFEAARRVAATLADLSAVLGARPAVLARELTKRFETLLDGPLPELAARVTEESGQRRGEVVVLVGGARDADHSDGEGEERRVLDILAAELPLKQAVALTARITGGHRNALYRRALARRDERA
ncbi:16S rRNA (cytidine(1402)-2'-O)-methyltransferase [uncultured Thiohalocapsa sp.]|uniref:16S rRNA (cytidine(1402)-2'-O)-methyltransferase n=1 Tax=uncultured Thiohalocapsa sp. TaxID=768990 RepID=UPI0025DFA43A|nr:16S rRNA (cytidine(1402)-2'-O)-methyltransferase [uncultured Thiohalocapsa sp.]